MESPAATENIGDDPSGRGPKLVRRTDDRVVAGVAAGIALRLGIAPVYARAAFVVLAFAGGAGVVLYGVGWALLPDDRTTEPPPATASWHVDVDQHHLWSRLPDRIYCLVDVGRPTDDIESIVELGADAT